MPSLLWTGVLTFAFFQGLLVWSAWSELVRMFMSGSWICSLYTSLIIIRVARPQNTAKIDLKEFSPIVCFIAGFGLWFRIYFWSLLGQLLGKNWTLNILSWRFLIRESNSVGGFWGKNNQDIKRSFHQMWLLSSRVEMKTISFFCSFYGYWSTSVHTGIYDRELDDSSN